MIRLNLLLQSARGMELRLLYIRFCKLHMVLVMSIIAFVIPLSACMDKKNTTSEKIDPPNILYNQGLANLEAGKLDQAAKKFESIDRQHPYTEYARKALVMAAFTNYRKGNYAESVNMAKRYVTLYPTSKEAAYSYYIIGLCYFHQIPDITRDQGDSRRTIEAMREVIERYPNSEYVEDAKAKTRFARDQLAGKEMQVGRYYLERKEYLASIKRFRTVVEEYSNTRHVEEALARLVEAYYALGLTSEAQMAAAVLGKNFPNSQWYKDSYQLLRGGGFEPLRNTGWMSKVTGLK